MPCSTYDLRPFLERLVSHSSLNEAERQAILDLPTSVREVGANRDIVFLGASVSHACVIVEGVAGQFGQREDGARLITALHLPGDCAGLQSVVLPTSRLPLHALTATKLLSVPHAPLRGIARRFPAIAEAFWRDCMVDASILAEWVINVGRRDARTRMAHLICEMALRSKARPTTAGIAFPLPLTQAHLADVTGLTSVHVNRTLRVLREDGLAEVAGQRARVLNWAALAKAGDFQPDYLLAA